MALDLDSVKAQIKDFVLREFLPGEPAETLQGDVMLISDGIMDSMGTLRLVSFIEETFQVAVPPHQIDAEHLDSVDKIAETIASNV